MLKVKGRDVLERGQLRGVLSVNKSPGNYQLQHLQA
jgi:hypothetical protein